MLLPAPDNPLLPAEWILLAPTAISTATATAWQNIIHNSRVHHQREVVIVIALRLITSQDIIVDVIRTAHVECIYLRFYLSIYVFCVYDC